MASVPITSFLWESTHTLPFLGRRRHSYIVFRNRFLYGFMFILYVCIDILYRDWNLRTHRVPMYVNLPVIKWQPFPATCGANGYSVALSLLCIDGFGCCALHGANRTYGDVWYAGVRYCLPLLCALWVSRRKCRSSREIDHDYSAQTRCGRLYKRETTTSFWNTEADRVFSG